MTSTRSSMAIHKSLAVALVAACALSLACSKRSELVGTWREPTASPGPYQSVVAIALTSNESTRRIAEDEFVRRLPKNTTGYSSYKLLSKEEEEDVDKLVARALDLHGSRSSSGSSSRIRPRSQARA